MTVLEAIKQICEERKRDNIVPVCAPMVEIRNRTKLPGGEIYCQIDKLMFDRVIERRLAMSGFTFYLTENELTN